MQSNIIISEILKIYKELCQTYKTASNFVSNKRGDSFYTIQYRENQLPIQIRISDHGTFLNTWVDRELLSDSKTRLVDPSNSINISIVFIDEGNDLTMDCPGQSDCVQCKIQPCVPQTFNGQDELCRNFAVTQYVYSSKNIAARYIPGITRAIMQAKFRGKYIDPLRNLTRSATTKQLTTNKITEHKQYTNMKQNKQTIKLNESQLRKIVREAVTQMLNELDPRTYASYAQKRAAQGQMDKAQQGRVAAVNAFNKQYGYDRDLGNNSGLHSSRYQLYAGDSQYPYRARTYHAESDPTRVHGQTINFNKDDYGYMPTKCNVTHRVGEYQPGFETQDNHIYHPYDAVGKEQTRIAHQMATGTGRYDKQTGKWQ